MRKRCARFRTWITDCFPQGFAAALLFFLSALVVPGASFKALAALPDEQCSDRDGILYCTPATVTVPAGWTPLIQPVQFDTPRPTPQEAANFGVSVLTEQSPGCSFSNVALHADPNGYAPEPDYIVSLDMTCTDADGYSYTTHYDNGFVIFYTPDYYECLDANFALTDATPPRCMCQSPECECPVDPLRPFTEPASDLDFSGLTPQMETGLSCLETNSGQNRDSFVTSAYRSPEYQSHFREIAEKRADLHTAENLANPACEWLRNKVEDEFGRHGLLTPKNPDTGQPDPTITAPVCDPARTCPHTTGNAIDVNRGFIATVDQLAGTCKVKRPLPVRDPVHVVPR
jgi:hypothetical protein